MCGFVAIVTLRGQSVDPDRLVAMRDTMSHRGPDGAGLHIDGPVGLGHRRLSIIDLSPAGHQPMCNEDQTVWLVFNGEIYNYVELTDQLKARGHRFRSQTDSEVILHLWEDHGEQCVDHLNGMFAFTIWDSRKQQLFGARDRAGIKPFQYYLDSDRLIAASEIKAILADPTVPRRPDLQGLSDVLMAGFPQGDKTCFEGIRQLQPGWALSFAEGRLRTWQYWDIGFDYNRTRSFENTVGELGELVEDAVRLQCRSDAPLGCHLSGGLDSSTIAALTALHHRPLHTFSVRFSEGPLFDESPFARSVARHVGSIHHEATPGPEDLAQSLATLAWHADIPMPDISSFSYYCVAKLAAGHVKVALTGHGGDEIFAGYPAQFQAAFGDSSMFGEPSKPAGHPSFSTRVHLGVRRHGVVGSIRRILARGVHHSEDLEARWVRLHCSSPLDNPLLLPGFRRRLGGYDPRADYLAPLRQAGTPDVLDRCLYHDLRSYLPGLLYQEDRASMAVSLESRVPLLDHRIIEFLATVPSEQKTAGRKPKAVLRHLARTRLPEEVVDRRHKGAFEVPIHCWFTGALAPLIKRTIYSPTALRREIFDPVELRSGLHGPSGHWSALGLEIWFRLFIDRDREWLDLVAAPAHPAQPLVAAGGMTP